MQRDNFNYITDELVRRGRVCFNPYDLIAKKPRFEVCIHFEEDIPIDSIMPDDIIKNLIIRKDSIYEDFVDPLNKEMLYIEIVASDSFYCTSYNICTDSSSEAEEIAEVYEEDEIWDSEEGEIIFL